jgi:CubicO group peptidase (beta-lactamase class C family)
LPKALPQKVGLQSAKLEVLDTIATNAIKNGAMPGCVILVLKNGKIAYYKAFGHYTYQAIKPTTIATVYDMASVTKICATTLAVMKLYDEGKINLKKTIGDYLPWVTHTNKAGLVIEKLLLHQAGLVPFIPFYKELIDAEGNPIPQYFSVTPTDSFNVQVADKMYLKNTWQDTMYSRILQSPLTNADKYVYSDNDFIFLAKIVEAIAGMPLNDYVQKEFYTPLLLTSTTFNPFKKIGVQNIAPTENEKIFRQQPIQGFVHDPGAAMFGGVAGHAGLFSNAYDIAVIMQMLLNGGQINGKRYVQQATVNLFTAYNSNISRRGLGFDKPEKDNAIKKEAYPSKYVSNQTFGHTGFTGTCAWADPLHNIVFVFLSNRIYPTSENNKLAHLQIRAALQDAVYKALVK